MAPSDRTRRTRPATLLFALLFLLLIGALVLAQRLPLPLLLAYLAASTVSFSLYALDKWAALRNRRRVRERTLHLVGLCCGWPGACLAQALLRHKSQKRPFLLLFRATVAANCLALAFWAGRWH